MRYSFVSKIAISALFLVFSNLASAQPTATDIVLDIVTNPTSFTPGTSELNAYSFTVSKSNSADSDVLDIGISASFSPAANLTGITWTCTVPTGTSNCDNASGTGSISATVDLNGSDGVLFTITNVTYGSNIFSNLSFSAAMTSDGQNNNDTTSNNDSDSVNITRASETDIGISVSDSSSTYTPGATSVVYTAVVSNSGPSDAQGVTFADVIPTGMTITSWSCGADAGSSCSSNGASNANVDPILTLQNGDSATIAVTVDYASSSTSDPLVYSVSASVTDSNATDLTPASASDSDVRSPSSSLAISVDTVTPSTTKYTPGNAEIYTVIVTNNGPSDVSGVTVVDNNLTEFQSINWSCSASTGSSCTTASANTRVNTSANIASGGTVTYTVNVTYQSGATANPLVYSVTATNPMGVAGTSPVTQSKSLELERISDLVVSLTDSATKYTPGLSGIFTAVITNNGPSDVSGVSVIDNAPAEFGSVSWTCVASSMNSACGATLGNSALDTTVDLKSGEYATFSITANFDSAAVTNPLVYTVTATNPVGISGNSPANASDNDDVLDRQVNLSIAKVGKTGTLVPNEPFTYTITVANAGPSDLGAAVNELGIPVEQGVILIDNLDTTLAQHSTECTNEDSQPCWEYCSGDNGVPNSDITPDNCPAGAEVSTDFGYGVNIPVRLASGSSTEVWIHARTTDNSGSDCDLATVATRELCNDASISISSGETLTTRNIGANPLTDFTSNEIIVGTDLVITKTDDKSTVAPGTQNSYTVTVRNDGFTNVQGISVSDLVPIYPMNPAGFVDGSVSWNCQTSDEGACCNTQSTICGFDSPTNPIASNNLNTSIDLDSQTEVIFTITGDIDSRASGVLTNLASASLPNGVIEADPSNNTSTDTTNLGNVSDISVTKFLTLVAVNSQNSNVTDLTYEIRVKNLGPSNDSSVDVIDLLDHSNLDVTTASWTCTVIGTGSCDNNGPVTSAAVNSEVSLAVDSEAVFNVQISTNIGSQGKVINTVTTTSSSFDPVSLNNSASVEYSLTGSSQIIISNDDSKLNTTPGLETSYIIKVSNEGPDDVFGANVINNFPAELTDIEWSCSAVSPIPGDLTLFQRSDQSAAGNLLQISPDDSHVYITSPTTLGTDSKLYVFKRNTIIGAAFGEISHVETITQGIDGILGIESPVSIAISSSGADLYVLSDIASGSTNMPAIAIFKRNTNFQSADFGKLTFQGVMETNIPTTPDDLLLSADQKHIYVSGSGQIQRYARDSGSGLLTYEAVLAHSDAGQINQSVNGTEIYVAESGGDTITAYSRETDDSLPAFGDLTSLNTVQNADISFVKDLIVSRDNLHLYAAASGSHKLIKIDRNLNTGEISMGISYDDSALSFNPNETLVGLGSLSISNDGEQILVSNSAESAIFSLKRNSQGFLSKKEKVSIAGLQAVSDVEITSDGKHVMTTAAGIGGKTLTAFSRRQPDPIFSFVEAEFDGVDDTNDSGGTVDGLLGTSAVLVTNDGDFVYATGLGDNSVAVFRRDKTKGSTANTRNEHLVFVESYHETDPGISNLTDVNSLAITPNGDYLFVGSTDQSTLTVFSRATDGRLTFLNTYNHSTGVTDGLLGVSSIAVDSSGQHLYVAGKFEASVAHYIIQSNGDLTLFSSVTNGTGGASGLAGAIALEITPDSAHVVVVSSIDDSVVVLDRAPIDGSILFNQHVPGVGDSPMDLSIAPDGDHIYVASSNDSRISVLKRVSFSGNPNFGQLTPVKSYFDNVAGFDYLHGARAIAVSKNGKKVYLGAEFDSAVTVMDRDTNPNSASYGLLTVKEVSIDEVNGVDGLDQVYDITVSFDSKNVYVAGFSDNAVASFVLGSGSFCSAQGSGNIDDTVDIGSNGTLTYTVNASIRPSATGNLVTESQILPPDNFTFLNPADNCSTSALTSNDACDVDSTLLIPETDLAITKTDNRLSVVAGEPLEYEIVVTNNGPSDAKSTNDEIIRVVDVLGSNYDQTSVNWTCDATGSGSLSYIDSVTDGLDGNIGLKGVSSIVVVSDLVGLGKHILATSVIDNGLLIFAVDPLTGELNQVLDGGNYVQAGSGVNLTGARDLIVIDDDIYVASQIDDSLVAFKASNSSGLNIQWVANHDFSSGAIGLNQAVSVIASNDGKNIYVAGSNDNSIVQFSRNLSNGNLTYTSTYTEGNIGNMGLSGVNALSLSNDGYSLYTSGLNNSNIGHYKRNLVDGSLQFVQTIENNSITVDLSGLSSIKTSNDDKDVYVTSVLNNSLYVFERNLSVAATDSSYGMLTLKQSITQGQNGVVGLLSPADVVSSFDANPSYDGRHVYVANEQSDSVVWFVKNIQSGELSFAGVITNSVANVTGLDGALSIASDDSGDFVYVAGSQDNSIVALTRSDDSYCPSGGSGDISVDVDVPVNGSLIFKLNTTVSSDVTGTLSNTAGVYSCFTPFPGNLQNCIGSDPETNNNEATDTTSINPIADLSITKTDGISQYNGLQGSIQVAGTSDYLYVAARAESSIGIFSRESNSGASDFGELIYKSSISNGTDGVSGLLAVSDLLISDDEMTLYAAGTGDNSVVAFRRDLLDGSLEIIEQYTSGFFGVVGIEGVTSIALSTDGGHLYASGPLTNSIAVFEVNQNPGVDLGKLTFKQHLQNGVSGVTGLTSVSDIIVSGDDKHVYVSSDSGSSVSVFLRNPNSSSVSYGELSYLTSYFNGLNDIAGLGGAKDLELSGSNGGDYLYVLGAAEQSVAVFSRDDESGELIFVEFKQNGTSNVTGLNNAHSLKLSEDEMSLYVAGFGESKLVVFDRSDLDGTITYVNAITDGDPLTQAGQFVDGLNGVNGVFIPQDDNHVYVTAANDNSLTVFDRDVSATAALGELSYLQTLKDGEGGVSPGSEVTYTIIASNFGPSDAEKVIVSDIFPPEFEQVSYQCFPVNGAGCDTNIKSGNVNEVIDLPTGSRVEIQATGTIRSDATGVLINTATVASSDNPNFAVLDPNLNNNSATDDDTLLAPVVDLVVTKTNNTNEIVPGTQLSYTITVMNDSPLFVNNQPADINGVSVTDIVPEEMTNVSWTCEAFPQSGLLDDGDDNSNLDSFLNYNDLDLFTDMVINSTGEYAFVSGDSSGVGTVLVYQRDKRTGGLIELQRLTNGTNGVNGLTGVSGLALSADGKNLYAVSSIDDSIITFTFNYLTSQLSFSEVYYDGLSGVNGLGGAVNLTVSLDGKHIYVAGKLDNSIAIFNRNLGNGLLTYNSFINGVEGLSGINSIAFHSSGEYLIAVSELNNSISSFARNPSNGQLSLVDNILDFEIAGSVLEGASDVYIQGNYLFVSSYLSDAISLFTIDDQTGMLSFVESLNNGDTNVAQMDGPEKLIFTKDSNQFYVASSISDSLTMFEFESGQMKPLGINYGINEISGLDSVNNLVIDKNGHHLYMLSDDLTVASVLKGSNCGSPAGFDQLIDTVDISSRGYIEYTLTGDVLPTATGLLTNTATALIGEEFVELNPSNNTASDTDMLTPRSDLSINKTDNLNQIVAGTPISYTIDMLSTGPSTAYASLLDSLPVFPTDSAGIIDGSVTWQCGSDKALQFNDEYTDDAVNGLMNVNSAIYGSESDFVYAISGTNGSISQFSKNTSGELSFIALVKDGDMHSGETVTGLLGANSLSFDTEENYLYVSGYESNSVVVFAIEDTTGTLTYLQTVTSGENGVIGLTNPVSLVVSPDNRAVYVAANGSDAVTVFSRDITTGKLNFVERVRDGFGTIVPESNVINEITDLVMSANGAFLYTTAKFSEAISIFSRDEETQILTFEGVIREGDDHNGMQVPSMQGLNSLVLSPNGQYLYALASEEGKLISFARDTLSGDLLLSATDMIIDISATEPAIPTHLILTPNAERLIIANAYQDSISLYDRNIATGEISLIDVFTNVDHGSTQLIEPQSVVTDGVNVLLSSVSASSLIALRITDYADCQASNNSGNTAGATILMSPSSSANMLISAVVHPSARGFITNTANISADLPAEDENLSNNESTDITEIIIETDVELIKTAPVSAIAGEVIEYTLTLTNTGPSDALGVNIIDTLSPALINASWTCTAIGRSVCYEAANTGSVNTNVDVTIDGQIQVVINATISPSFNGLLENTATAVVFEQGLNTDTDISNNESVVSTLVSMQSDIVVTKTNNLDGVISGQQVDYEITVLNLGPSDSPNTVITDIMPIELTDVTWTCTTDINSFCTINGSDDISDSTSIQAGSQLIYNITGYLPSSHPIGTLINTVTAEVQAPSIDENLSNNTAQDSDEITIDADVEVILTSGINPYDPQSHVSLPFMMQVINHGPSDATDVLLSYSSNGDFDLQPNSLCSLIANEALCDIGYTTAGQQLQYPIEIRINDLTRDIISSTAEVLSNTFDSNLNNNTSTLNTDLITGIDVRVTKTDGVEQVEPEAELQYVITIENIGSLDAGIVTIDEQLPAELINTSWTCIEFDGASCINVDEFAITGSADLPAGGKVELILNATVDPSVSSGIGGFIVNVVEVESQDDINQLNNIASDSNEIVLYIFKNGFEELIP